MPRHQRKLIQKLMEIEATELLDLFLSHSLSLIKFSLHKVSCIHLNLFEKKALFLRESMMLQLESKSNAEIILVTFFIQ